MRALVIWIALSGCSACTDDAAAPEVGDVSVTAIRSVEEDALFHSDPRWLGGDAAYSVALGDGRSLWLFGDSFIATSAAHVRTESTMVRNSIALMTATNEMQFAWRDGTPPTSFFPEAGDHWFWPTGGARVPGAGVIVFASEIRAAPGEGLGFAGAGVRAFYIADVSGSPTSWTIEPTNLRTPRFDTTAAVACTALDGDHLVAVVAGEGAHHGMLARWPIANIGAKNLADPQWWSGTAWVAESALRGAPAIVLRDAATECSLSFDEAVGHWMFLWSRGFGNTTIAVRLAKTLTGPWSAPQDVMRPAESLVPNAFVYAAKAHPQLVRDGAMLVTFADNSFTFADVLDPARAATLYWPHAVRLSLRRSP